MRPEVAHRRIEAFGKRFGEAHLYLAYHAAFPLALTPDLLYRLWANFQRDIHGEVLNIPWIAVADLLLSSLCDEVGHELYEMEGVVRNTLLSELKANPRFGTERINELSDFLLAYVRQQLDSPNIDTRDFAQAQKWTALAYTRPSDAAREIASALKKSYQQDRAELVRMASLVEILAKPLAEFEPLLVYARGMANFARGNYEGATAEFVKLAGRGRQVDVAGVSIDIPSPVPILSKIQSLAKANSRSLRVSKKYIKRVKFALQQYGYPRQKDLAEDLGFSLATVNNFLNGKRVDYMNFIEICRKLGQDWQAIAQLDEDSDEQDSLEEQKLLTSDFYIERVPYESQCYEAILKPGALIRIKAPQQMGKTTLLERVLSQVREHGYQTLTLNFKLADSGGFSDSRQFSRWFCASVGHNLGLTNKLDEYWDDIFGCNTNTTAYFQDYLLAKIASPLVLALDNVDLVFEHPSIANDFCRLLRSWYDIARRGDRSSTLWKNLRLVVVHSTEVYSSLDINHSPMAGVGLVVELPEFSPLEVQDLARLHGLNWNAVQIEQLMAIVGGHPYLVQIAFHQIKRQEITLEQILQTAPTETGIYRYYLRQHLGKLQQHPELAAAFNEVVTANSAVKIASEQAFKLNSMALVNLQGNEVIPRCDLYRLYFREHLRVLYDSTAYEHQE